MILIGKVTSKYRKRLRIFHVESVIRTVVWGKECDNWVKKHYFQTLKRADKKAICRIVFNNVLKIRVIHGKPLLLQP